MTSLTKICGGILVAAGCVWGVQTVLEKVQGGVVMMALMAVACGCVCFVIFMLTKAYYGPAPELEPTPETPPDKSFLKGRKKITLEELSVVWRSKSEQPAAQEPAAKPAAVALPAVKSEPEQVQEAQDGDYVPPWERKETATQIEAAGGEQEVRDLDPEVKEETMSLDFAESGDAVCQAVPENTVSFTEDEEDDGAITFFHDSVIDYYNDHVITKQRGFMEEPVRLRVATALLTILDRHGDCPSVVDALGNYGEINSDYRRIKARKGEGKGGESFFDILAGVTLLEHSLNVAKRTESFRVGSTQTPLYIIEALAHDIGKIPEFREGRCYATGDHPVISCNLLRAEVDGFNELPEKDQRDIEAAVRYHHREKYNMDGVDMDHIRMIQRMDREARNQELSERLGDDANLEAMKPKRPDPEAPPPKKTKLEDTFEKMEPMNMDWFRSEDFFERLIPHINLVDGGKYRAVSTRDGYIYVWVELMSEIVNEMAAEAGVSEVVASNVNQQGRYRKLRSLVSRLRKEGFVAANLIQEKFFSAPFLVHHEDGRVDEMTATPFLIEAFGRIPSELERLKDDPLVKDITNISVDRRKKDEKEKRTYAGSDQ